MANQCYCGRSQILPYCDGSHARPGAAASSEAEEAEGAEEASEAVSAAKAPSGRPGLFERLFGRRRDGQSV